MKTLALLLAVGTLGLASADTPPPQYLEGGALIAHVVPELAYTVEPPPEGWCTSYAQFAISSCEEQNNRVDVVGRAPVTWFLLAAWLDGDKEWCGCEFGFGNYDAGLFDFRDAGPCFPADGVELSTPGWPGPNEGTAIVAAPTPWSGNFQPMYRFCGYAYSYPGPGVMQVGVDPATGFAGFSNCATPVEPWPAASLGGLGINTAGAYACPEPYAQRACCFGDSCCLLTYLECSGADGGWLEGYDSCEPAPSPCEILPLRACCMGNECLLTIREQCDELGGHWWICYTFCDPNPCGEQPGAVCCIGEECLLLREADCLLYGGVWYPEWQSCLPNLCRPPVPVDQTSWGRIKALFRAE